MPLPTAGPPDRQGKRGCLPGQAPATEAAATGSVTRPDARRLNWALRGCPGRSGGSAISSCFQRPALPTLPNGPPLAVNDNSKTANSYFRPPQPVIAIRLRTAFVQETIAPTFRLERWRASVGAIIALRMSAFGGIADIGICLLFSQKRTLIEQVAMSALCHKQTLRPCAFRFFKRLLAAQRPANH
jgi:hypothetical protein